MCFPQYHELFYSFIDKTFFLCNFIHSGVMLLTKVTDNVTFKKLAKVAIYLLGFFFFFYYVVKYDVTTL